MAHSCIESLKFKCLQKTEFWVLRSNELSTQPFSIKFTDNMQCANMFKIIWIDHKLDMHRLCLDQWLCTHMPIDFSENFNCASFFFPETAKPLIYNHPGMIQEGVPLRIVTDQSYPQPRDLEPPLNTISTGPTGDLEPPLNTISTGPTVVVQKPDTELEPTNEDVIAYSCFVTWCCCSVCGIIGFIFAGKSPSGWWGSCVCVWGGGGGDYV